MLEGLRTRTRPVTKYWSSAKSGSDGFLSSIEVTMAGWSVHGHGQLHVRRIDKAMRCEAKEFMNNQSLRSGFALVHLLDVAVLSFVVTVMVVVVLVVLLVVVVVLLVVVVCGTKITGWPPTSSFSSLPSLL